MSEYERYFKHLLKYENVNELLSTITDLVSEEQSSGFNNSVYHYKIVISVATKIKNRKLLEIYLDFLERDLELLEILMGVLEVIGDDINSDDIREFDDDLYQEMKILYEESNEIKNTFLKIIK